MTTGIIRNKIFNSALVRIIFGLIICLSSIIIAQQIFLKIPAVKMLSADSRNLTKGIFVSILLLGSYWFFYSKYEKRIITELSINGLWRKLFTGILIGNR